MTAVEGLLAVQNRRRLLPCLVQFDVIILFLMGSQQSKKRDDTLDLLNSCNLKCKYIVTEKEFITEIFKGLDSNTSHTPAGPIIIVETYIVKAFYDYLKDETGQVYKEKLTDTIKKMYDKPEKAIEYSHRMIAADRNNISRSDFTSFIEKSLDYGMESIIKRNKYDRIFQKGINDWIKQNKPKLMTCIQAIFQENAQSNIQFWTLGDFKRWILLKEHWTLYIQIKDVAYKIPLNIPCMLGIRLE